MAAETRWTKGPWHYDKDTMTVVVKEWKNNSFMGDYRGCVIAGFEESHGGLKRLEILEKDGDDIREQLEANAQLIASAPALYEALEKLIPIAKAALPTYEHDSIIYGCAEHVIAEAESALRAARGER